MGKPGLFGRALVCAANELAAHKSGSQSPADSLRLEKLQLEQVIEDLKAKKEQLSPQDYTSQLESLLVQLAKTNQRLKKLEGAN